MIAQRPLRQSYRIPSVKAASHRAGNLEVGSLDCRLSARSKSNVGFGDHSNGGLRYRSALPSAVRDETLDPQQLDASSNHVGLRRPPTGCDQRTACSRRRGGQQTAVGARRVAPRRAVVEAGWGHKVIVMSATEPSAAKTFLSTGSDLGASVRSVHSPSPAKNRK